jgi:DNA topoisomerase-1
MAKKKLVIVESPTKTKSLAKYLGPEYLVISSKGHIVDLPKSQLGIDLEHHYAPLYTPMEKKRDVIQELKKDAKASDEIYLATDLDREGEAIAWHIVSTVGGLDKAGRVSDNAKYKRVVFAEITKDAIQKAFAHPRGFDYNLIDAYQARRVLDRLVGYSLSPLLWKKIQYGLSAGRVQSVAVRLVVEREGERKKFHQTPYFRVWANVTAKDSNFTAELTEIEDKGIETKRTIPLFAGKHTYSATIIQNQLELDKILTALKTVKQLKIVETKGREATKNPEPPFTTASLQRSAQTALGYSAKQTMIIAQKLYEHGYITYHRTDSTNLSQDFLAAARKLIQEKYGPKYLPENVRVYKTKQKSAQEAHEAIRPTHLKGLTAADRKKVGPKEAKLYELIWKRALASQAAAAVYQFNTLTCLPEPALPVKYTFTARGTRIIFDGYRKILNSTTQETILPDVKENDLITAQSFNSTEHQTTPPPRYNEASLIKDLEAHGIGRPSTYAPIIDTIQNREYVYKENGAFVPEDVGTVVNKLLVENFPETVDLEFTSGLEDSLDKIAEGNMDWEKLIDDFYKPFAQKIATADDNLTRDDYKILEHLAEKCPECGHNLVLKLSKYGKFYSCSNFPECKYARPYIETIGLKCYKCQTGDIVVRRSNWGKKFFGCSRYPECDWASWKDPRDPNFDVQASLEPKPKRTGKGKRKTWGRRKPVKKTRAAKSSAKT